MTCLNSAANVLGLSKQDNTNDTFAADVEQFKLNSKYIQIMQMTRHRWCMLITLFKSLFSRNISNN